jgi:hypothetical protein
MKGFAFAQYDQRHQLLAISHDPASPHPAFKVLQRHDYIPCVDDRELQSLRDFEGKLQKEWAAHLEALSRQAKRKRKKTTARAYVLGQRVKVEREAFAGLIGEIKEIRGSGDLVLAIKDFLHDPVVPSCDVTPLHLSKGLPEQAKAA